MAKTSKVVKNEKRRKIVAKYAAKRKELKEIMRSPKSTYEEKEEAARKFHALPRDSSPIRVVNRCAVTGRPRGHLRKFGLCRNAFRELAHQGLIPGVTKSSW